MKWVNLDTQGRALNPKTPKITDKPSDLPFVGNVPFQNPTGTTTPAQRIAARKAAVEGWSFVKQIEKGSSRRLNNRMFFTNPEYPYAYLGIYMDGNTILFDQNTLTPLRHYYFSYATEAGFLHETNLFMKNNPLMPDNNIMEKPLAEKATSKAQQQAAGIAHAVEKGELPKSKLFGASKQMFDSMSSKELDKFASTKHKGLPKHVQTEEESAVPADRESQIQAIIKMDATLNPQDPPTGMEEVYWKKLLNRLNDESVAEIYNGMKKEFDSTGGKALPAHMRIREINKTETNKPMEENIDTQTPTTTAKAEQNPVTAQGNVVVQEMPTGDSVFNTKPMWKNMMEAMNVPSTPEPTEECSTPKKKKYRFTEEQVKMIKEIQVLKESMNKLENGKKLLF